MKKILVIDDQKSNLFKIKDILEKSIPACKVLISQSGVEGIEIAKTEQPDTILLDVIMPEMDGFEVCEKLKASVQTKYIPIILLSAFEKDTDSRVKGLRLGANVFLSKPIDPLELSALVTSMLRVRAAEKEIIESEERFKKLSNLTFEGILIHDKGMVIDINESLMKLLGYTKEELIGKNIIKLCVPHEYHATIRENIFKNIAKPYEVMARKKDGTLFPMEIEARDIKDKDIEFRVAAIRDISWRKKAEKELRESEKKYRSFVDTASDMMCITDKDGKFTDVNESMTSKLEYSREELIGKSIKQILTKESFEKDFRPNWEKFIKKGEINIENTFLTKKGKEIIGELKAIAIYDKDGKLKGTREVIHDLTERKRAEELLRNAEKDWRNSFNSLKDVMVIIDKDFNIENINDAGLALTGKSKEEVIGNKCYKIFHNTSEPKHNCPLTKTLKTREAEYVEIHEELFDGYFSIKSSPVFDENGEIVKFVDLITDITRRKQAEVAIHQQNLEIKERNEELDAFSHTVAHDLKNPLASIMGFADILFEGYSKLSEDDFLNYLSIIVKEGIKTQQIINSLLLLANVRKADIITEELNMKEIVSGAISSLTAVSEKSNTEIKLPETWPVAIGYTPWIIEVWMNYLSNAIKYCGTPPHIEIGADKGKTKNVPEGMARFWIRDNGPGISVENQKLLFKKFERLDQVKTKGHGLGLSIVRRIIEKLSGQVGVESEIGKGSLFYFTLPYSYKNDKN